MSDGTLKSVAERLVAHCRAHTTDQGLVELYDDGAVSVEAMVGPGQESAQTVGLESIKGKHAWWAGAMEVHSESVEGPFLHGDDRFAVIFEFDATDRSNGARTQMREVGVYTLGPAGRIVREEFFYTM